jgi:hypothetical protein
MKKIIALCLLLVASPAFGLDLTSLCLALDGKPLHETNDPKSAEATISYVIVSALTLVKTGGAFNQPVPLDGPEQLKRYTLAQKIMRDPKNVTLTADEITMIEKAVGDAGFGPVSYGRVYEAIDPGAQKTITKP